MKKVIIIAEAGVNHNGDLQMAKRLVDVAYNAGANAVKFQSFSAESLATMDAPKADYQKETTDNSESHFDMLKRLEMSPDMHSELYLYCQKLIYLSFSILFFYHKFFLISLLLLAIYFLIF